MLLCAQAFLDMKQITQMLEALFLLCQRLCGFVQVRPVQQTARRCATP